MNHYSLCDHSFKTCLHFCWKQTLKYFSEYFPKEQNCKPQLELMIKKEHVILCLVLKGTCLLLTLHLRWLHRAPFTTMCCRKDTLTTRMTLWPLKDDLLKIAYSHMLQCHIYFGLTWQRRRKETLQITNKFLVLLHFWTCQTCLHRMGHCPSPEPENLNATWCTHY